AHVPRGDDPARERGERRFLAVEHALERQRVESALFDQRQEVERGFRKARIIGGERVAQTLAERGIERAAADEDARERGERSAVVVGGLRNGEGNERRDVRADEAAEEASSRGIGAPRSSREAVDRNDRLATATMHEHPLAL